MRALVTGATGFIGRELLKRLERPVALSRDPRSARALLGPAVDCHAWDPGSTPPPAGALRGVDVIFHLAGEPVAEGRWTPARKDRIRDSRLRGTQHLVAALETIPDPPRVLVSASAIGYYGERGDEILDESSRPGSDWLAGICAAWEAESARAAALGVRVVNPRIGIVLGAGGGALARILPPFRMGVGGRLGTGRQWTSWIHIDDLVGLLLHAAAHDDLRGAMNAVSPGAVTNAEFTRTLASVLRRPAFLPVPALALKIAFGEMAGVLLSSQHVAPRRAETTGYAFRHAGLEGALRQILVQ